jgi:hypothetical protein
MPHGAGIDVMLRGANRSTVEGGVAHQFGGGRIFFVLGTPLGAHGGGLVHSLLATAGQCYSESNPLFK